MRGLDVDGLRYAVSAVGMGRPLLLLHGFTGRGSSWSSLAAALRRRGFRTIAPDLPGHGRSAIPRPPERGSVERIAADLAAILARIDAAPADVLGYSFGARVALRLALDHPATVRRLVLESPAAGLADPAERAARLAADGALADRLERDGIETFVAEWERLPIFASQGALPPARAAAQRRTRLRSRPAGLAASLRGAGQGAMEPLGPDRLRGVTARTLVIAGALDPAGVERARLVAGAIPGARLEIVREAGHAPHLERPAELRRLVLDFLQEDRAA